MANLLDHIEIVAFHFAIAVHRVDHDFAGAQFGDLTGEIHRIQPRPAPAVVRNRFLAAQQEGGGGSNPWMQMSGNQAAGQGGLGALQYGQSRNPF